MTKTTLTLHLISNGREFILGPGQPADITKITGLEASQIDVGMTDRATLDGATVDGVHVKSRPIHIEGSFRSNATAEEDREQLIRFFNPKHPGTLSATIGGRSRSIGYYIEGWSLKARNNLDARVGFVVDLICPDPYFISDEEISVEIPADKDAAVLVTNDGDIDTGFIATIAVKEEGETASLIGVNNSDTGESIYTNIGIADDQVVTISTEPGNVYIKLDEVSIFTTISRSSVPFRIPVGGCHIYAGARLTDDNITCLLTYRERFLGI